MSLKVGLRRFLWSHSQPGSRIPCRGLLAATFLTANTIGFFSSFQRNLHPVNPLLTEQLWPPSMAREPDVPHPQIELDLPSLSLTFGRGPHLFTQAAFFWGFFTPRVLIGSWCLLQSSTSPFLSLNLPPKSFFCVLFRVLCFLGCRGVVFPVPGRTRFLGSFV